MAIFKGKTEENKEKETVKKSTVKKSGSSKSGSDFSWVLKNPRLSEKAIYMADKNVFVFNVDRRANKILVASAIKERFGVEPVKINIVSIPRKKVVNLRTGIKGMKAGGKKAYVFLKEGDSINLI